MLTAAARTVRLEQHSHVDDCVIDLVSIWCASFYSSISSLLYLTRFWCDLSFINFGMVRACQRRVFTTVALYSPAYAMVTYEVRLRVSNSTDLTV